MARLVTLTTLRQRLRWRTDTMNTTQRFPDAEVDDCINEGIAQFHAEIIRADGQGFAETSFSFTTVKGTELYALPAAILELVSATVVVDGCERPLYVYDQWDRPTLANGANYYDCGFGYYRLIGNQISLMGTPNEARLVKLRYIATSVMLTAPTDTLDGIGGCEEFAIAWGAQRVAIKNQFWDLNTALNADKAETLDRMRALVNARNASEPNRTGDAAGRQNNRRWSRRSPYGRGMP